MVGDWMASVGSEVESERKRMIWTLMGMALVAVLALGVVVCVGVYAAVKAERHTQWREW